MSRRVMVLGTRGSALALAQTNQIRALLHRAFPSLSIEIKIIKTTGDKKTTASLARSGVKGLFTKELEQALLRHQIDVAIHSLKDLPTEVPSGLDLGAVTQREEPNDVLVSSQATTLKSPRIVFTSSPRRAIQARLLWPSCEIREIRGNIETRLAKIAEGKAGEAILLAAAGLRRLDYLRGIACEGSLYFSEPLSYRKMSIQEIVPAPGQAAIAIETRADDGEVKERLRSVNHRATWNAVLAERTFLNSMGGGCAAPMAAHATVENQSLNLIALVAGENGRIWRGQKTGDARQAEEIGNALAIECRSELGIQLRSPQEPSAIDHP